MREYLKELLIVLASSWDPWIPIAMWDWDLEATAPQVASKSYTTDASFSCLLPST